MPLVWLQRTLLLLGPVWGGCADSIDAPHGYPKPEQGSHEGGPTRPVPNVQERRLLDSLSTIGHYGGKRFPKQSLGAKRPPSLRNL